MYLEKSRPAASYSTPLVSMTIHEHLSVFYFEIYTVNAAILILDHTHAQTHIVAGLGGSCGKRHKPVVALEWAETPPESQLNSSNPSQRKEEYRGIRKQGQIPQYTITVSQWTILSHTHFFPSRKRCLACRESRLCAFVFNSFAVFPKEKARQH